MIMYDRYSHIGATREAGELGPPKIDKIFTSKGKYYNTLKTEKCFGLTPPQKKKKHFSSSCTNGYSSVSKHVFQNCKDPKKPAVVSHTRGDCRLKLLSSAGAKTVLQT